MHAAREARAAGRAPRSSRRRTRSQIGARQAARRRGGGRRWPAALGRLGLRRRTAAGSVPAQRPRRAPAPRGRAGRRRCRCLEPLDARQQGAERRAGALLAAARRDQGDLERQARRRSRRGCRAARSPAGRSSRSVSAARQRARLPRQLRPALRRRAPRSRAASRRAAAGRSGAGGRAASRAAPCRSCPLSASASMRRSSSPGSPWATRSTRSTSACSGTRPSRRTASSTAIGAVGGGRELVEDRERVAVRAGAGARDEVQRPRRSLDPLGLADARAAPSRARRGPGRAEGEALAARADRAQQLGGTRSCRARRRRAAGGSSSVFSSAFEASAVSEWASSRM